jgi:hypothetical protein
MSHQYDDIVIRHETPARPLLSLLDECYVERGNKDDWNLLHELHYKAARLPIGPQFYRCVLSGEVIGVGVMASPKMMISGRNELFEHMKPNQGGKDSRLINQARATGLNKRSTTNSRLVLDTMFRGAGIAYRMQNLMMRLTGLDVIEFQSSMSKFNPFAAKAGIQFTRPRRSQKFEKGINWFRRWFASVPADFMGVMEELNAMPPAARAKCEAEMRTFYYKNSSLEKTGSNAEGGAERVQTMPVGELLKQLQQLVLASPLYGVYLNPDAWRDLPPRIPLLAFDNQPTDQPLRLDLL